MSATTPAIDLAASSVEIAQAICDIQSVSGDEKRLADAIQASLAPFSHMNVVRDGDAIVASTGLGRSNRVVIAGHIDTVPVNNNLPSKISHDDDGEAWLWGRGTVDMKAGVAVALKLAAELTSPRYDVTWIWYDHEEVDASLNGLGRLATKHPELLQADFAILGEPSNSIVEGGCNGTLRAEIRTRGVRSHSARSWMGENAIHKLAGALSILESFQPEIINVDGLEYREGLSAVGISGGVAGNVIPDEAVLRVNYRFAPNKTIEQAITYLLAVFQSYDVVVVDQASAARPGLDAQMAREFVECVGVPAAPKYGWTDVARFAELGIPAVNFGPGNPSLAHMDDERVLCSQITEAEHALRKWLSA